MQSWPAHGAREGLQGLVRNPAALRVRLVTIWVRDLKVVKIDIKAAPGIVPGETLVMTGAPGLFRDMAATATMSIGFAVAEFGTRVSLTS